MRCAGELTLALMTPRERRTVKIRAHGRFLLLALAIGTLALTASACGRDEASSTTPAATGGSGTEQLSGNVEVDGSSTVGPLTTAAAESYREQQPDVNVTVGISGTGGGFERFCAGETDISDASRPIEDDEAKIC